MLLSSQSLSLASYSTNHELNCIYLESDTSRHLFAPFQPVIHGCFGQCCLLNYWSFFISVSRGTKLTEQVIIGTPGKVFDWATKLRCLDLSKMKVFVLDEADIMIDTQGLQDQSIRIHK